MLNKLRVTKPAAVSHVLLEFEGGERLENTQAQRHEDVVTDGPKRVGPRALLHPKADAAPPCARHFVSARAILRKHQERHDGKECNRKAKALQRDLGWCRLVRVNEEIETQIEQHHLHDAEVDRQHNDRDQKAKKLLKTGSSVINVRKAVFK